MEVDIDGPSGPLQLAVAVLVGLAIFGWGAYSYTTQTSALNSATQVEATITSTSVETFNQRRGTDYGPQATFEYTYEGENYTSSNVYPGELPREFDSENAARDQLDGYEPGDTVTAYVPPNSPGNAYLMHESSNKPFLVMGFGVLFVLGAAYSALRD
ncbi:DUF3592 domain-containing protein [Halorussus salinus]|uniref:DUF3592 domain-containing protein n=1 Tax=Halorussus salinus TaxID=1364935 RepID=UPI001092AB71|nr:DUF3592 domain-containing protein [Halorussus salinus]